MTYLEIQAAQRKQVADLRGLTLDWLTFYNVTRSQLAKTIYVSESYLSDFLTEKRGLSAETFLRLGAVVSKPANPNRNARLAHVQNLGIKSSEGLDIDIEDARLQFNAQRSARIDAENKRKNFEV